MNPILLLQLLAPFAPMIEKFGMALVADLTDVFSKDAVTGNDFRALIPKYGMKTAADYLAAAMADPTLPGPAAPAPTAPDGTVIGIVTAPPAP